MGVCFKALAAENKSDSNYAVEIYQKLFYWPSDPLNKKVRPNVNTKLLNLNPLLYLSFSNS